MSTVEGNGNASLMSMLFDENGNGLGAFPSLRQGIKALQEMCEEEPECRDGIVLMVYDQRGTSVEALTWEDVNISE